MEIYEIIRKAKKREWDITFKVIYNENKKIFEWIFNTMDGEQKGVIKLNEKKFPDIKLGFPDDDGIRVKVIKIFGKFQEKVEETIKEPKEWKEERFGRFIESNEIIIEDLNEEDLLNIASKMNKKENYSLEYWKAPKQETGHLHIKNITFSQEISFDEIQSYKIAIIKKYVREDLWDKVDWNFYNRRESGEPHRIATENEEHYKGYGIKTLIKTWGDEKYNPFEEIVYEQVKKEIKEKPIINSKDIEDHEWLINKCVENWKTGNRQNTALSLAGYLRKNKKLGIEQTKSIITEICNRAKDEELQMRLGGVTTTFNKDESEIKGISGLEFLKIKQPESIYNGKEHIQIPKEGRLISEFSSEIGNAMMKKNILFYRSELDEVVEITKDKEIESFSIVKPNKFITLIEDYIHPFNYKLINNEDGSKTWEKKIKSISGDLANTTIQSSQLKNKLPKIERIFNFPIPIFCKETKKLTFPKEGYDERFNSWLPKNSPKIIKPEMKLEEAKNILLNNIFPEFCFKTEQDKINAIAGLLTPFLRGLYPNFTTRTPLFFYLANRERAGKDYCAGITAITYLGKELKDPAISTGEKGGNKNDEFRKKIFGLLQSGRNLIHSENNKGYLNNAVLEGLLTTSYFSDRVLGKNDIIDLPNELDFSMSGNIGISYTPDFANRCRFIRLFLDIEDPNKRTFDNTDLHGWVKSNRGLILSSLYSLIRNWFDNGKPESSLKFSSFPEWASICGGIMECAGFGNPCAQDIEILEIGGDVETNEIKQLFEICYNSNPNEFIKRNNIITILSNLNDELFNYLDFTKNSDLTKFGMKLNKYEGRIFSNIRLIIKDKKIKGLRREYKFIKIGVTPVTPMTLLDTTSTKNILNSIERAKQGDKGDKGDKIMEKSLKKENILKNFTDEEIKSVRFTRKELEESIK